MTGKRLAMLVMGSWLAVSLSACPKKDPGDSQPSAAASPIKKPPPDPPRPAKPAKIVVEDVGLKTPESVLYDAKHDVYLVANINGSPFATDDNGFISKVAPDGKIVALKWIDGATKDVALDAPKGMALTADTLWVADITRVRKFDRESGAPKGEVKIPKATFVNDIVAAPEGDAVFVSDSGFAEGFKPSGSDGVWKISGDKAEAVIKDKALGHPNGLAIDGGELVVVTFGSGEVYRIKDGNKTGAKKAPQGSLDGIVPLAGGGFLVSSWAAKTVYKIDAAGDKFEPLAEGLDAPADIGLDTKRKVVLVPLFSDDKLVFWPLT